MLRICLIRREVLASFVGAVSAVPQAMGGWESAGLITSVARAVVKGRKAAL